MFDFNEIYDSMTQRAASTAGAATSGAESTDWSAAGDWAGNLFSVEQLGSTLVIVPQIQQGRFRYSALHHEANSLRRKLDDAPVSALIFDLHAQDYNGSDAIDAVKAIARKAENAGLRVAFCGAAPDLRETLMSTGLHQVWPLYDSRQEAIAALGQ
jgi:anti-sigma B factor antagonist